MIKQNLPQKIQSTAFTGVHKYTLRPFRMVRLVAASAVLMFTAYCGGSDSGGGESLDSGDGPDGGGTTLTMGSCTVSAGADTYCFSYSAPSNDAVAALNDTLEADCVNQNGLFSSGSCNLSTPAGTCSGASLNGQVDNVSIQYSSSYTDSTASDDCTANGGTYASNSGGTGFFSFGSDCSAGTDPLADLKAETVGVLSKTYQVSSLIVSAVDSSGYIYAQAGDSGPGVYIRDTTDGSSITVSPGDEICIAATQTSEYGGLLQIADITGLQVISDGNSINATALSTLPVDDTYESMYVSTSGYISSISTTLAGGGFNHEMVLADGSTVILREIAGTSNVDANFTAGDYIDYQGILGEFNGYQLILDSSFGSVATGASEPALASGSISPANLVTDVPTLASAQVNFNRPLDTATVNANIRLCDTMDCSGSFISDDSSNAAITYNAINSVVTIKPDSNLSTSTTYYLVISAGLQDADGTPYGGATGAVSSFTTSAFDIDFVINEFLADPSSATPPSFPNGDANGDGIRDYFDDEFIEIVNNSGTTVDIDGWTIEVNSTLKHTFSGAHTVSDGGYVVVFGGGTPSGIPGDFVETASEGSLNLGNTSGTITIKDNNSNTIASYTYGTEAGNNESITRDPDITGSFVGHTAATDTGGKIFSPGTKASAPVIVSFAPVNGANHAITNRVVEVTFSKAVNPATVTASTFYVEQGTSCSGSGSAIEAVSPSTSDNTTFTLTFSSDFSDATDYTTCVTTGIQDASGTALSVDSSVSWSATSIIITFAINEILADPAGGTTTDLEGDANGDGTRDSADDEFIEIVNTSGFAVDIENWTIEVNATLKHTFTGTHSVSDGAYVTVFGGGTPTGIGGDFVETASNGSLGLGNSGATVTIKDSGGATVVTYTYGSEGGDNQSITRDPDLTGSFVKHSVATNSGGTLFSPGQATTDWQEPGVDSFSPVNGGDHLITNRDITVTFTEAVNSATVTSTSFYVEENSSCTGTPIESVSPSTGDNITFTLSFSSDFTDSTTYTTCITTAVEDSAGNAISSAQSATWTGTSTAITFVFNEVHADPDATNGDANGDAAVSTADDEFLEIINTSAVSVDISAWEIHDAIGNRHTFPGAADSGTTVIPAGGVIVIFGGGTPTGISGDIVDTASSGTLGLNNSGETVYLKDDAGADIVVVSWGSEGGNNQSITRDPDITGSFVQHSAATDAVGALFSPGTKIDGSAF